MNKLYDRIYWHNNTTPALNESNLNSMSKAIDDIDDRVIQLADEIVDDIADIHTWHDETYTYMTRAEQYKTDAQGYASNAMTSEMHAENHQYTSEAWAVGQRNGTDVSPSSPQYHNNSKYYAEQAQETAQHAGEDAEAWAVGERGGVPVSSTDPAYNNNSKYYAEQSADIKDDCEDIKDEIIDAIGVPIFVVNFTTGELEYDPNITYNFTINTTTGNLEWEVVA